METFKYSVGETILHKYQKYKVWSRYRVGASNTYMLFSIPDGNFRTVRESSI